MSTGMSHATGAPARGRLDVDGGRLAYAVEGKGPGLLFVHSVIADQRMWEREARRFARDHRTIRYDLRGFGGSDPATGPYSPTDDIASLLAHLKVERPFIVGSSAGGAVAIDFALQHPESVRGLLLAAPGLSGGFKPPFDPEEQAALDFDDQKSQEIAAAWSRGDATAAIEFLRQLWCSALTGSSLELFRTMVDSNRAEVFDNRSAKHEIAAPAAAGRLAGIRTPTTVLCGDRDNPSSPIFAKRIAHAIPGARLVLVPGADHLINLSRPGEFDQALEAALQWTG